MPAPRSSGRRSRPRSASRLSIVTGGPGTGKTATIRLICAAAKAQRASIALVAPTGRAARRMAESTGMDASTIHSALGWIPGQGPTRDEIEADLLVVDETSMANLELLVTLLRAVGPEMHVVLVGDADQLAPVGAGKPFAELVEAEGRPGGRAHAHLPPGGGQHDRPRRARGPARRAAVVRGRRGPAARPVPDRARRPARRRWTRSPRWSPSACPTHYGVDPLTDIQVFAPVYKGALGIDAINTRLRARAERARQAGARRAAADRRQADALRPQPARARADERHDAAAARAPRREADGHRRRDAGRAAGGGGAAAAARLRVLDPQGPGDRAAGGDRRRPSRRGPVLPAPRDALHGDDARAGGDAVVGQRAIVARAAATPDTSRRFSRLGVRLAAG